MSDALKAMIIVMAVMIIAASLFNIPLSNNFLDDYNVEFTAVQRISTGLRSVGDWIIKAYNTVFGTQTIGSAIRNLPKELDSRWLYVGQPSCFFADNIPIVSPFYASDEDINAMFDLAYRLLCEYMSDSDAKAAMDEFAVRCVFFFDKHGAVYPSFANFPLFYNDRSDWIYLDHLDESSGIANFLNNSADWIEEKLDVGYMSDLYFVSYGMYWSRLDPLNLQELIDADVASPGVPYRHAPVVALPFSREVWLACTQSTPYAWHLAGGYQIDYVVGG